MSVHLGVEPTESYRELLEESFDQVERTVSWVSRRLCITGDDADEFRSWVNEKLVDDDYRVLREFSGRSSLATYLVAVIQNLARDFRMKRWGRWRPSAAAIRLGLVAEQLETLMDRDGFTLDEAFESLRSNHGVRMTHLEIVGLAEQLPTRTPLRFEGEAAVATAVSQSKAENGIKKTERKRLLEKARRFLAEAIAKLSVEDRLVLRMHYQSGLAMSAIASVLGLEQRFLYTRRDRCRRELRAALVAEGLDPTRLFEALEQSEEDFKVDYGLEATKLDQARPSNILKSRDKEDA